MRDIRYGPGDRALMDVFLPANGSRGEGIPIVAFFHGGYWQSHERAEFGFVARAFATAGICTAIVGYDLAPGARMGAIVAQARAAFRQSLGFNPVTINGFAALLLGALTAMLIIESLITLRRPAVARAA